MEHGHSWFSLWSLFNDAQHFLDANRAGECTGDGCAPFSTSGLLFGNPASAQPVFAAILVFIVLSIMSLRVRMHLKNGGDNLLPSPKVSFANLFELVLEKLYGQSKAIIGKDAARYFPVLATLTLFIFFSNLLGLLPGFLPPTDNWNTTMACGLFVFLYYNWHGLRVNGWHHIAHLANPTGLWWGWFLSPLLFPVELFGHLLRPFTLGVRLAANLTGDHILLGTFLGMVPWIVPLPFFVLGLFVCAVQTLVFILLSMAYLGLAVAEADHGDHGHDHGEEEHGHDTPAHHEHKQEAKAAA